MQFDPIKALKTLRQFAIDIDKIGKQLEQQRLQLIMAQATLYDAEKKARDELFTGQVEVMASKSRDWLKWQVLAEQYDYDKKKEELRLLVEKKEIMVEVVNAVKASMRLWELENKNNIL